MPRPLKHRNPQTGEPEDDLGPEASGTKPTRHGPERTSLSLKLATERHRRLLLQNAKLQQEQRAREGNLVDKDVFMRQVLAANHTVKNRLLALPERLAGPLASETDPRAIRTLLREAIITELNESAYPPQSGWLAGLGRLKDG